MRSSFRLTSFVTLLCSLSTFHWSNITLSLVLESCNLSHEKQGHNSIFKFPIFSKHFKLIKNFLFVDSGISASLNQNEQKQDFTEHVWSLKMSWPGVWHGTNWSIIFIITIRINGVYILRPLQIWTFLEMCTPLLLPIFFNLYEVWFH